MMITFYIILEWNQKYHKDSSTAYNRFQKFKAPNKTFDENIVKPSEEQKKIHVYKRLPIDLCKNEKQRQELKSARNKILHKIKKQMEDRRNKKSPRTWTYI